MGDVDVRDDVFGVAMNRALVHQVMVGQLANARQGTSSVKTRAQVSGGGAKPRMQKYTGRARQGTIRAPHWRGGGVVFGPSPGRVRHRTPKRMKRLSLVTMLSDKVREDQLVVVDNLELEQPKTKEMVKVLRTLQADSAVLMVADGVDPSVLRCARNIPPAEDATRGAAEHGGPAQSQKNRNHPGRCPQGRGAVGRALRSQERASRRGDGGLDSDAPVRSSQTSGDNGKEHRYAGAGALHL